MALTDTIQNEIQSTVPQMIDDAISNHFHDGNGSQQIQGQYLSQAPQSAMTTASAGSLSSGGTAILSNADAIILNNALTRIAELESKLQNLALIN